MSTILLPDGSPPPTGDAAIVLALFDPMGIANGAYPRQQFARHLASVARVAPDPQHIENIISELTSAGLIAPHGVRADPSLNIDDGPGGADECFVTTPLGKKAARLCKWLADPSSAIAGPATDRAGLTDIIIEALGDWAQTPQAIDVACCCAPTEEVEAATSDLMTRRVVERRKGGELALLPPGTARLAELRHGRQEAMLSEFAGALRAQMFSPPEGLEGRDARALAFDARLLHPEVVATCRPLFIDGHFTDAVLNGCKRVAHGVQARAALATDGDSLFAQAFKPDGGMLKFNPLSTNDDRNEQRGLMLLYQGMWAAIRNPNAHRFLTLDHTSALEHISFLSLLLRYLDTARP